jgi:glycosyltransferase involved in cell wall biosynthesis
MPPVRSGVATVSAELVPALREWYDVDVFVHRTTPALEPGTRSAHDFVWLNQQAPYDLTVFQLGNSSVHNYMWPYLFRYPGLTVLHDVHLHHARAAALLQSRRAKDYRLEFAANHPDADPDLAEVAVAGFDNHLYYQWPMIRLVAEHSRITAVHARQPACQLRRDAPAATVEAIHLGHGRLREVDEPARQALRARYRIPEAAVVFGCFGGLSPEKRLPQILTAFAATQALEPEARLLLVGAVPHHYDLHGDIERARVAEWTMVTGYLNSDEEMDTHIAACDVALNLRWPTAREVSGPWLRSLAAGVPTVITQLTHLADVPSLDPRTWRPNTEVAASTGDSADPAAVCVAIDLLDEDHSLRVAMRRLARDAALRRTLGAAGRAWWQARHAPAVMLEDYRRIIPEALERRVPEAALPPHLLDEGFGTLDRLAAAVGVPNPLR